MPRLLSVNVGLPRNVTRNGKTVRAAKRCTGGSELALAGITRSYDTQIFCTHDLDMVRFVVLPLSGRLRLAANK
jgi:hypothetical protein